LLLGVCSLFVRWRRRLYDSTALHRFALLMAPSGLVAVLAGWVTTEVGRQPFTVYNLLTTAESASPLGASAVGASLIAFVITYFVVFGVGTWYILRLMAAGLALPVVTPEDDDAPIRTAGITPGPGMRLAEGD
jgi:cytochrome d ubiquinol oxidase subunit I